MSDEMVGFVLKVYRDGIVVGRVRRDPVGREYVSLAFSVINGWAYYPTDYQPYMTQADNAFIAQAKRLTSKRQITSQRQIAVPVLLWIISASERGVVRVALSLNASALDDTLIVTRWPMVVLSGNE